ncbi:MarR family transcriptional regulator [Paenibacillus sp. B01]|uniref:MarR family transcriptional regulator n=1 Tax=Paenibacillus sp. B01 TaxID=2660554 RepID=UPI00129BA12D|nr:MarR family transcriptional regulator [Paenibacillus sp. B01]QGG55630.1 MarR family transcriptional regulator [Paenibacillus sp. B01]
MPLNPQHPLSRLVGEYMQTLVERFTKLQDPALSAPQYSILQTLAREGRKTSSELAARLEVTPSAVTNLSTKLVQKGYVERIVSEQDRRIMFLQITESGMAAEKGLLDRFEELMDGAWESFTEEEQLLLERSYRQLIDHLRQEKNSTGTS